MTALDVLILGIFLFFTGRGIWRGFINDLAGLLALVLGYLFAGRLAVVVEPFLSAFIDNEGLMRGVAYYLSLFGIYLAVVLLGKIATRLSKLILLGWLNRLLGALTGMAKGVLVAALVAWAKSSFSNRATESPRRLAPQATAAPVMPPPMMIRS